MSNQKVKPGWVIIEGKRWTGGVEERITIAPRFGIFLPLPGTVRPLSALKNRRFIRIKPKGINEFLRANKPVLSLSVTNTLTNDGTKLPVTLVIDDMSKLEPPNVARQIPPLNRLMDLREAFVSLLVYGDCNDQLKEYIRTFMQNSPRLRQIRNALRQSDELKKDRQETENDRNETDHE